MIQALVILLSGVVFLLSLLGFPLENFQGYLFIFILLTVGIPHGALDHKIMFTTGSFSRKEKIKFYAVYVLLMMITGLCWLLNAQWSFILFLLISAFHFGQSQLYYVRFKGLWNYLLYLSWGVMLLSAIIYLNIGECINFFYTLPQLQAHLFITPEIIGANFIVSATIFTTMMIYALLKGKLSIANFGYEFLSLTIIVGIAASTTAVMAFIIYFGLWHSLVSLILEYRHIRTQSHEISFGSFLKDLIPHSTAAFLFLAVFYWYSYQTSWAISPYMLFIILISIITVPHLFVMGRMYNSFRLHS